VPAGVDRRRAPSGAAVLAAPRPRRATLPAVGAMNGARRVDRTPPRLAASRLRRGQSGPPSGSPPAAARSTAITNVVYARRRTSMARGSARQRTSLSALAARPGRRRLCVIDRERARSRTLAVCFVREGATSRATRRRVAGEVRQARRRGRRAAPPGGTPVQRRRLADTTDGPARRAVRESARGTPPAASDSAFAVVPTASTLVDQVETGLGLASHCRRADPHERTCLVPAGDRNAPATQRRQRRRIDTSRKRSWPPLTVSSVTVPTSRT